MTLWNPRTLFSRDATSSDILASFDPIRTGATAPGLPDVEVGYAGHGGSVAVPGRNPIGFAPPADPSEARTGQTRFRTEISFKRYSSTVPPHASAGSGTGGGAGDDADEVGQAWVVPHAPADGFEHENEFQAEPVADNGADEGEAPMAEEHVAAAEKIPFYKREMTFRRRKAAEPEAAASESANLALDEDEVADVDAPDNEASDGSVPEPVVAVAPVDDSPVEQPVFDESPVDGSSPGDPADDMPTATTSAPVLSAPDDVGPASSEPVHDLPVPGDQPLEDTAAQAEADDIAASVDSVAGGSDEPDAALPGANGEPVEDDPAPRIPVDGKAGRRPFARERNGANSTRSGRKSTKGRKMVGLKIDASQIAAAVVVENNGINELVQLAQRSIDSGIVVDGEVRDAEGLAHELKLFFEENDLPKKGVRIGLSSNRIGVRTFDIAGIDDEERFDNAVRFRAHEVLPVAQDESVLDYRTLEERPTQDGETSRRILLVVAPRDQVNPYVAAARDAGLKLDGLDLEALSLLRAFVDPKPFSARLADDTATVVVSIGHESTTLLVSGGGACEFTRVFRWGGRPSRMP